MKSVWRQENNQHRRNSDAISNSRNCRQNSEAHITKSKTKSNETIRSERLIISRNKKNLKTDFASRVSFLVAPTLYAISVCELIPKKNISFKLWNTQREEKSKRLKRIKIRYWLSFWFFWVYTLTVPEQAQGTSKKLSASSSWHILQREIFKFASSMNITISPISLCVWILRWFWFFFLTESASWLCFFFFFN